MSTRSFKKRGHQSQGGEDKNKKVATNSKLFSRQENNWAAVIREHGAELRMKTTIPEVVLDLRVPDHIREYIHKYHKNHWLQAPKAGKPSTYVFELFPDKILLLRIYLERKMTKQKKVRKGTVHPAPSSPLSTRQSEVMRELMTKRTKITLLLKKRSWKD